MWSWSRSVYERAQAASWTSWALKPGRPKYTDPEEWAESAEPVCEEGMGADFADYALAR